MAYKKYRGKHKTVGDSRKIQQTFKGRRIDPLQIEKNKYYCWYCKFPCDVNREALGGSEDSNNISYGDSTDPSIPNDGNELSNVAVLGGPLNTFVGMKLAADGVTEEVVQTNFQPIAKTGCPFCGSLNWKGKY